MCTRRSGRTADGFANSNWLARLKIVVLARNRDADGQRRGRQQQRLTNQRAQRVAQILEEVLDEGDAAGIAALLLDRGPANRRRGARPRAPRPGVMPAATYSSICSWRWSAISCFSDCSAFPARNNDARRRRTLSIVRDMRCSEMEAAAVDLASLGFAHDQADRRRQPVPALELASQLPAAGRREGVELRRRARCRSCPPAPSATPAAPAGAARDRATPG